MLFYALVVSAISVAVIGLSTTEEPTLPVTTCKRDSDDYSACLKRAVEKAWSRFMAGLPEFDFPPLDPLVYKYGRMVLNSAEIRGELIISNQTFAGISKTRIFDVKAYFLDDVFHLEIDTLIPKAFLKGAAKINGSLNIFRVVNEGYFNLTVEDVRSIWDLKGHVVNDTWIIEHFLIAPSLGSFKVHYNDSMEESKEISNIVIGFINEFWPTIYRIALPFMVHVWESYLIDTANIFFSKFPFSKVFP